MGITPRISSKSGALASDELHGVPASTANEWESAKNNLSKEGNAYFYAVAVQRSFNWLGNFGK
jgi:hypothetical protein